MTTASRTWLESLLKKITEKYDAGSSVAARAERLLGEIALNCGEKQNAVAHFQNALKLDPRVGVKRLLGLYVGQLYRRADRPGTVGDAIAITEQIEWR